MKHVLLIDDDTDMLAMTGRWLTKAGYRVSTVDSGEAALALLSEELPDLVLLDFAMPGMDGPEVLAKIRADERTKNIPVLFRTGMDDGTLSDNGDGPAPNGVLPKSEGKPFLLNEVKKYLG